ncbi:MAG: DNA-3-methyladenine glycosylase [Oscillospiraceae bacterium]|nr:DNA-3-methyladenine glycosylase [Oscillospiraceae bacterium]
MILPREFYMRDTVTVAKELLGQVLVHETNEGVTKGVIVETEAYLGKLDDAAHSYKKSKKRVSVQYEGKGLAYVYMIYGIHYCMNLTSGDTPAPEAILIRALEPVEGLDIMARRRGTDRLKNLCSGPGKLAKAMDITLDNYGEDLTVPNGLYIERGSPPEKVLASKRIGVDYAVNCRDRLWRFTIAGNPFVSAPADSEKKTQIRLK